MIKYGLKAATKDIDDGMAFSPADLKTYPPQVGARREVRGGSPDVGECWDGD